MPFFNLEPEVPHNLLFEWPTRSIFPNGPERKADFCALIQIAENKDKIPILVIEAGKDEFNWENQHKDSCIILEIMAANCIALAYQLKDLGKDVEKAQTYGILIGGLKFQLCVARAVLRVEDGKYAIHAEITFRKHWLMSLRKSQSFEPCDEACCVDVNPESNEMQTLSSGTQEISENCKSMLRSMIDQNLSVEAEAIEENLTFESEQVAAFKASKLKLLDSAFDLNDLDYRSLQRLERFIYCVKKQALEIANAPARDYGDRPFHSRNENVHFSQSHSLTSHETPAKKRPRLDDGGQVKSNPPKFFSSSKKSLTEFKIYLHLWAFFPANFARVYKYNPRFNADSNEWDISYEFEKLEPLVSFSGEISDHIWKPDLEETLKSSLKFLVDVLFGLEILHSRLGIVHCDLSLTNIMYSSIDDVWKLIDFDFSESLENCNSNLEYRGGTRPFIAPEVEKQGIYSEKSDIYALGRIISIAFVDRLSRNCDENSMEENISFYLFALQASMTDLDPNNRPTVLEILNRVYRLINLLIPDLNDTFYRHSSIMSAKHLLHAEMGNSTKQENPKSDHVNLKRPITKEAGENIIFNTIEPN